MVLGLLFLIIIILGFLFPKSKVVSFLQFFICLLVFSFGISNPDYIGYYNTYKSANISNSFQLYLDQFELGYRQLVYLFSNLGFDFNQFRVIIFICCYILITLTIRKYTQNKNFVYSFYMIFPFCMDCIQMRNFISSSIIIYIMPLILDKNKKPFLYVIGCIIAALFHSTGLVYLIFCILCLDNKKFKIYYFCLFSLICIFCFNLLFINIPGISNIKYFSSRTSIFTYGFFFILLFLLFRIMKYIDISLRDKLSDMYFFQYSSLQFFKTLCLFVPFLVFHFDFFRLIRNIMIYISIYIARYLFYNHRLTLNKLCIGIGVISIYCILLYRSCFYSYDISLWQQVFENNLFFI